MDAPFFDLNHPLTQRLFDKKSLRAQLAAGRKFAQGPIEIFDDILSTDPRMMLFKARLSDKLTAAVPENVDEFGRVYGTGARSNFYGIRHLNGLPMIPATWPLSSNVKKRHDAGLADGPVSQQHAWIFQAVVRLFFSDLEPVPLKIRRGSSTCVPFFSTDKSDKEEIARYAMKTAHKAGRLMIDGKFEDAYILYQMGGAYYVVYRAQSTDGVKHENGKWVSKDRLVADFEYAISGGARGTLRPASKDPTDYPGLEGVKGMFRERRRTAMGGPFAMNAAIMPVAQSVRKRIYSRFAYAFHHTTREDKEAKVRDWDLCIATDVSDHDTFWPGWLRDLICDELLDMGYADWWVAIFRTSLKLPIYVGAPGPDEGHVLIGDWRDPQLEVGLSSGQGATDLMGTILMSCVYTIMQLDHTAPHLWNNIKSLSDAMRFMDNYLQGKEEIKQISKSDDAMLGWARGPALAKGQALLEKLQSGDKTLSPYMVISYEHGGAFLGDILLYEGSKKPSKAIFVGNILSMVNNQFSPEYGTQSKVAQRSRRKRPFPGLAWASMQQTYGNCPAYGEVMEIIESEWFFCFGESYRAYRETMLHRDTVELSRYVASMANSRGLEGLTTIDLEVLANPEKLQYKYTDDDVSAHVADAIMHGVPVEEVAPYLLSIIPR